MTKIIPKYNCLDNIDTILDTYKHDKTITNFITDLKNLIFYQMIEIRDQRSEIIALKHKFSWNHYDKTN